MVNGQFLHGLFELFRTVCVDVFGLGLGSNEPLEPSQSVHRVFGFSGEPLEPECKPVLNDQGYLIMRPRLVVFVEDRMIRRDGVGELFGFWEFVWSSPDFDTACSSLCLAPAADGALWVLLGSV